MIRDIPAFLDVLRKEGELVEIDAEVDPNLEIAEVHRRVIAAGGPALLFKRPKGYDMPVVTNLFGTPKRVELAFGRRPRSSWSRRSGCCTSWSHPTLGKLWDERDFFWQGLQIGTKTVPSGPVTEVIDRPARIDRICRC
jgi:UbiD family decarboxylase